MAEDSIARRSFLKGAGAAGAAGEGVGDGGGHSLDDTLEVLRRDLGFSEAGVENAIGGLLDMRLLRHLGGGEQGYLGGFNHKLVF